MANHTSDSAAQGYYLCSLPRLVLLNIIDRLPAKSATCLGLCSAELRGIAFSDEVWQARCEAKQWEPIQGSWQRGYSNRQRIACRECGRPSKYVFALLGCRLCEKCEHQVGRTDRLNACAAASAMCLLPQPRGCLRTAGLHVHVQWPTGHAHAFVQTMLQRPAARVPNLSIHVWTYVPMRACCLP